jgi:hypothetical protein
MRRCFLTRIFRPKNPRSPVAGIVLTGSPRKRVCHLLAIFPVQAWAGLFRYALTVARRQYLWTARFTAFCCMHNGTLQHRAERVKMQNYGSEGLRFESPRARFSLILVLACRVVVLAKVGAPARNRSLKIRPQLLVSLLADSVHFS